MVGLLKAYVEYLLELNKTWVELLFFELYLYLN